MALHPNVKGMVWKMPITYLQWSACSVITSWANTYFQIFEDNLLTTLWHTFEYVSLKNGNLEESVHCFVVFLLTILRNLLKIQVKSTALLRIPLMYCYGLANCVISWRNHWPEDRSSQTLLPPLSSKLSLWPFHPVLCALLNLQAGKVSLFEAVLKISLE